VLISHPDPQRGDHVPPNIALTRAKESQFKWYAVEWFPSEADKLCTGLRLFHVFFNADLGCEFTSVMEPNAEEDVEGVQSISQGLESCAYAQDSADTGSDAEDNDGLAPPQQEQEEFSADELRELFNSSDNDVSTNFGPFAN
jgi:hypothetical protein